MFRNFKKAKNITNNKMLKALIREYKSNIKTILNKNSNCTTSQIYKTTYWGYNL